MFKLRLFTALFVLLVSSTVFAQGPMNPVSARAAISSQPVVQGSTATIAVEVKIKPPFHIQSATPLDPNFVATEVHTSTVPGVTFGAPQFPVDEKIAAPEGTTTQPFLAVYSGTVYVRIPVTVAVDAPLGPQKFNIALTTQACDDKQCLPPKKQQIEVEISVAAVGTATQANEAELFAAADKQAYAAAVVPATAAVATAPAKVEVVAPKGGGEVKLLSDEEQVQLIRSRHYRPFNAAEHEHSWLAIILLALAGGVILNVMPCVLPVIPLKVLSLVQQAHGDRRLAAVHGVVFSAGVITLFVALAIVLRAFGLFYGQQFQSVGFLIALVMFVVALALSMLGVWTLNPPQALYAAEARAPHAGYAGSFANGLMATLLATPCSAPFLGGVLAWALVQPTVVAALMLALVGVGMSLPYLILAMFPGALAKLPKAGRWTELLKQGLGIVMIGVAVYLITLIPNVTYWPWVLLGAVAVALVCWAWGQIPTYEMPAGKIWTIRVAALVVGGLMGVGLWVMASRMTAMVATRMVEDGEWKPFNVALLDAGLAEGRPVVVDWGASWCINCRVLETAVLHSDEVSAAFKKHGALLLRADLTSDNPPASVLNQELGGESIPVLAIFSPGRPTEPVVLRDSYTKKRVEDEVAGAGAMTR